MKILRTMRLGCLASLWLYSTWSSAMEIPEIPKVPAFLPTVEQVPATQPMPLDGTWLVPVIGKKLGPIVVELMLLTVGHTFLY